MTVDPIADVGDPFNARYGGRCSLMTCERKFEIEIGDVCQYVNGEIMHHACARRWVRGQAAPLCQSCYCYHVGECA